MVVWGRGEAAARAPLTSEELGEELIRSRNEIDMLELRFSLLAAEFDATDEADMQGSVSSIDWIRHNWSHDR